MDENRLAEIIAAAFEKLGISSQFADLSKNIDNVNDGLTEEEKKAKKQRILLDATNKQFAELDNQLKKGKKSYVNLTSSLELIDDRLEDMEDSAEKLDLEMRRAALGAQYLSAQSREAGKKMMLAIGDTLLNGTIKGTQNLVRGLQDGASGTRLATDFMINSIDMTQSSYNAVAQAGETVGGAMVSAGGKTRKFGVAVGLASQAFSFFTGKASELAKFGLEVMTKEVEKTVKSFNSASAAGAVFTDGMGGMRNAAKDAGLTLEQFSNAITQNSTTLAESGLTVGEATKKMGKILVNGGDTFKSNLLRLGFSVEEHAGLVADVMASMRRSNTLATATNPQIVEATEKYATNLRIIADITGDDAKKRMEQAKEANTEYAFQRKVAEIAIKTGQADLASQLDAMIAAVGPNSDAAKSIRQMILSGSEQAAGVTTVIGSRLSGFDSAIAPGLQGIYSGTFEAGKVMQGLKPWADDFVNNTKNTFSSAGTAVAFGVGGVAAELDKSGTEFTKLGVQLQNAGKGLTDVTKEKDNRDKATNEFIKTELAAQKLRVDMENEFTKHMGQFNKITASIVAELQKTLSKMTGQATAGTEEAWYEKINANQWMGMGMAGVGALLTGTGVGAGIGVPMMIEGGLQAGVGTVQNVGGFAAGGISTGPVSGHQETLHGTEAVIPLPDGKTIPVEVQSSTGLSGSNMNDVITEIRKGNQSMYSGLQDLIKVMKDNNSLTSGILQNSY